MALPVPSVLAAIRNDQRRMHTPKPTQRPVQRLARHPTPFLLGSFQRLFGRLALEEHLTQRQGGVPIALRAGEVDKKLELVRRHKEGSFC